MILDAGPELSFLAEAAQRAFNVTVEVPGFSADVHTLLDVVPAQGAALRALEWGEYYDSAHANEWRWDYAVGDWVAPDEGQELLEAELSSYREMEESQEEL